jgi:hypothetical protein
MSRPIVRIHDLSTNEIIDREMNDDEFAKYEIELAQIEAIKAEELIKQEEAAIKAQAKSELLERLGITAEEAQLLLS